MQQLIVAMRNIYPNCLMPFANWLRRPDMRAMSQSIFPAPDHDHDRCAADALAHAEALCEARAQRLTPIRRQVLEALLASHRPLGAYEIIERTGEVGARPAPITVYR